MVKLSRRALGSAAVAALLLAAAPAQAADPIKVGMSLALTGAGAPAGKMLQAAIELWRDDVNAKGGLHRPPGRGHHLRRPEQPGAACRASTPS